MDRDCQGNDRREFEDPLKNHSDSIAYTQSQAARAMTAASFLLMTLAPPTHLPAITMHYGLPFQSVELNGREASGRQ